MICISSCARGVIVTSALIYVHACVNLLKAEFRSEAFDGQHTHTVCSVATTCWTWCLNVCLSGDIDVCFSFYLVIPSYSSSQQATTHFANTPLHSLKPPHHPPHASIVLHPTHNFRRFERKKFEESRLQPKQSKINKKARRFRTDASMAADRQSEDC